MIFKLLVLVKFFFSFVDRYFGCLLIIIVFGLVFNKFKKRFKVF